MEDLGDVVTDENDHDDPEDEQEEDDDDDDTIKASMLLLLMRTAAATAMASIEILVMVGYSSDSVKLWRVAESVGQVRTHSEAVGQELRILSLSFFWTAREGEEPCHSRCLLVA
jgi:hypothetical protein